MFSSKIGFYSNPSSSGNDLRIKVDTRIEGAATGTNQMRLYIGDSSPLATPVSSLLTIKWGDGTQNSFNVPAGSQQSITKTYGTAGVKTITITGYGYFSGNGSPDGSTGDNRKIIDIIRWGNFEFRSMRAMFRNSGLRASLSATDAPNLTNCTNLDQCFRECYEFNDSKLFKWDVSNITSMSFTFQRCINFNRSINNWNVSNVTNMSSMFFGATSFNQPLFNWNVSNVTDMNNMFFGAPTNPGDIMAFNQPLNSWNVSNVTNMLQMFALAQNFNQPLNSWNVSNVTSIDGMFNNCLSFNQNLSSWITGVNAQPSSFSFNANPTWVANKATLFPYLSDGVTRINT